MYIFKCYDESPTLMVGQPFTFIIRLLRRRGEGLEVAPPASPLCEEENPENEDAAEDSSAEPER